MNIQKQHLSTGDEYTKFVREFVTLLDEQLSACEEYAKKPEDLYSLAHQMPAIISLINTVGYLRGQDGIFLRIRPSTENQKEFYEYEDKFEERLKNLIDILMASNRKDVYKERLESYFIKSRT
jgi:hypothetical protein